MNKENLQRLIKILEWTKPSEFSMADVCHPITGQKCLIGLIQEKEKDVVSFSRFSGICPSDYRFEYLISSKWSEKEQTNTIGHAINRIQRLLDGYEPNYGDITKEMELIK